MPSSKVDFPVPFSPTMIVIGRSKVELEAAAQKRQAERIGLRVRHALGIEPDAPEIRRRHLDGAPSARHGAASCCDRSLRACPKLSEQITNVSIAARDDTMEVRHAARTMPQRSFVSAISANNHSRNARTLGRVSWPFGQTK